MKDLRKKNFFFVLFIKIWQFEKITTYKKKINPFKYIQFLFEINSTKNDRETNQGITHSNVFERKFN